jgi:glutamate N-acetyltransferase/amino-acid N-acetyltransferase
MVAVLANGQAGNHRITTPDPDLMEAFYTVCEALSRMIAKDGEGATKLIEVKVLHARSPEDAYRIALSVAKSPLVKTMIFGEDANWGRILTAVGYAGANFDPAKCDIRIGGLEMCHNGAAVAFDEEVAKTMLAGDEIPIEIDLNEGTDWDRFWTCDFTYDYVKINGSYRT